MSWNPVVFDVEDVPSISIDVDAVDIHAKKLGDEASDILIQVGKAQSAWNKVEACYQTGHTAQVVAAPDDLWWSANLARHVYMRSAWALGLFADDLRACEIEIDRLRGRVKTFRKQNLVDLAAMQPGSAAFIINTQLWIKAAVIRGRVQQAIATCDARLAAIQVEAARDDPYANHEFVKDGGFEFWDRKEVTLEELDWNLFGTSGLISGSQVDQGNLGNCWFMASLAALADTDSDAIRDMIRQRPDGSYAVRLFVDGEWQEIIVDNAMLIGANGRPQFAGDSAVGSNDKALWPLLVEKAAIQALGGDYYDLVAGRGAEAMEMFTGHEAQHTYFDYSTPYDHVAIDKFAHLAAQPDILMTASARVGLPEVRTIDAFNVPDEGSAVPIEVTYYNNHVYQVQGIDAEGNVTLVNPHNSHASSGGYDKDEFTISPEQFNEMFTGISVGSIAEPILR